MTAVSIQQMTDRISVLLGEKLRLRGSLGDKAAKARRRLPKAQGAALAVLVEAERMSQNPRLLPQIDYETVAEAYDLLLRHLNVAERREARKTLAVGIAASAAFSLLVALCPA